MMLFLNVSYVTNSPHATSLGYLSSADVYEDQNAYPSANQIPKIKIFRFEENIHYANVDMFRKLFAKRIGFRVDDALKSMNSEINRIEEEYRSRLSKSKVNIITLKKYFHKDSNQEEKIEFDEDQLKQEKEAKVGQRTLLELVKR